MRDHSRGMDDITMTEEFEFGPTPHRSAQFRPVAYISCKLCGTIYFLPSLIICFPPVSPVSLSLSITSAPGDC